MQDFDKVTTRQGDGGETGLFDGSRLGKDDQVFQLLGDLDELNSWLGVVRSHLRGPEAETVRVVQEKILVIGSETATPAVSPQSARIPRLSQADIRWLEREEQLLLGKTTVPDRFILPGENRTSAFVDVARSVARRAERSAVYRVRTLGVHYLETALVFLNRLSDYLFVLARFSGGNDEC